MRRSHGAIHDTIEVFSESLEELQKIFRQDVAPKLHARRKAELEGAADKLFGEVDDTIREAALMAVG
jgi:branched-subunit amino acid aminotransferase/4-amino-4-deoxychorismate lyase